MPRRKKNEENQEAKPEGETVAETVVEEEEIIEEEKIEEVKETLPVAALNRPAEPDFWRSS